MIDVIDDETYGLNACYQQIKFEVEELHFDPICLLGKYILRNEQDPLFNSTMIPAMKQYIKDNNIKWND
jgi:hypothetical protein